MVDEDADGGYVAGMDDIHVSFCVAGCVFLLDFMGERLGFEREGCMGSR